MAKESNETSRTDLSQVTIKSLRKHLEKKFACECKGRYLEAKLQKIWKKRGRIDTSKNPSNRREIIRDEQICPLKVVDKMSSPQVVKALWVYIERSNLQNPEISGILSVL